jgi:ABC-type multidrug transport system ATPase subunit
MAVGPSLLLVDEPEGGMDAEAIKRWREVITRSIAAGGPTVVVAAHRPAALESVPLVTVSLRASAGGSRIPFTGIVGAP